MLTPNRNDSVAVNDRDERSEEVKHAPRALGCVSVCLIFCFPILAIPDGVVNHRDADVVVASFDARLPHCVSESHLLPRRPCKLLLGFI